MLSAERFQNKILEVVFKRLTTKYIYCHVGAF